MSNKRFISFDTWAGAMNNIRLSYELAAALSYVSDRTLILPPRVYCLFLSDPNRKETFWDFWELFDREAFEAEFDTIAYEEVPEYERFNSDQQYFDGICDEVRCLPPRDYPNWGPSPGIPGLMDASLLECEDTFIHFPRNLFGFWYTLIPFPEGKSEEEFRAKLKRGLKIRSDYQPIAIPKPFNAIHVRMGDFNFTRPEATRQFRYHLNKLVSNLLPRDLPLFIATNETNREFFDCLKDYDCHFSEIPAAGNSVRAIGEDILTCVEAERFHGSRFSTFTDYINILRHYLGKEDCSGTLLNYQFTGDEPETWENLRVTRY